MSVSAQRLRNINSNSRIAAFIREICHSIDNCLLDAKKRGDTTARYELPMFFTIDGVSDKDARLIVHGSIVEIYDKNGLSVSYNLLPDSAYVTFKWVSTLSETDRRHYSEILARHMPRKPPASHPAK